MCTASHRYHLSMRLSFVQAVPASLSPQSFSSAAFLRCCFCYLSYSPSVPQLFRRGMFHDISLSERSGRDGVWGGMMY